MRQFSAVTPVLIVILCLSSFSFVPGSVSVAQAHEPPETIVYNLFATDAFVQLADGTLLYNYGFVGGRKGVPLTFQNSMMAVAPALPGANTTIATGAPDPTGGPVTATELQLAGNAQYPAPLIYAAVGDVVEIRLKNLGITNKGSPNDPHSIHLHGLDVDAANDGVPETSLAAVPANLAGTPGAGNVVVYMFSPKMEGSYMYHCHQEADIHVQMGMYGALIVYSHDDTNDPASDYRMGGPGKGNGGTLWGWKYTKENVLLLSEVDVRQHISEQTGARGGAKAFNPVLYQPQYWFINGLSFPNTIHVTSVAAKGNPAATFKWADWIAAHPGYDPLIVGSVGQANPAAADKILLRMINMGFETQPMHMHGFHGKVLGSDQRAWTWAQPAGVNNFATDTGLEKNTLTIGSGEVYEWLIDMSKQAVASTYASGAGGINGTYPGGTQSRYGPAPSVLPTSNTTSANPAIPAPPPVVGLNYIGGPQVTETIDPAINAVAPPSQIFVFHNHDDYKATNNGAYPGGMFTVIVPTP